MVKIPHAVENEYYAVTSPKKGKVEALMKFDDRGEEAVILQEENKVLEEVITPLESKTLTESQLNCDCSDHGSSPKNTVTGKEWNRGDLNKVECKYGIVREIIFT